MKKLGMTAKNITFEDGCNKYLENCRQRNLKEGTIGHWEIIVDPVVPNDSVEEFSHFLYYNKKSRASDERRKKKFPAPFGAGNFLGN